jgi:hypothetical protein
VNFGGSQVALERMVALSQEQNGIRFRGVPGWIVAVKVSLTNSGFGCCVFALRSQLNLYMALSSVRSTAIPTGVRDLASTSYFALMAFWSVCHSFVGNCFVIASLALKAFKGKGARDV